MNPIEAGAAPKVTVEPLKKLLPVIITGVLMSGGPEVGVTELTEGIGSKTVPSFPVPSGGAEVG